MLIQQNGSADELWRNNQDDSNYLMVNLLRDVSTSGLGTRTRPDTGAIVRMADSNGTAFGPVQEVNGGKAHGSQRTSKIHFGLPSGPNQIYHLNIRFRTQRLHSHFLWFPHV
ncbi:MAG: hypothetical protein R3A11_04935 [Bdellovibrionota bacterium]